MFTAGKELPGFHVTFANGWTVSVQWHVGAYADPSGTDSRTCRTAEMAAWDSDRNWYTFADGDKVAGYRTPEQVVAFMNEVAGF